MSCLLEVEILIYVMIVRIVRSIRVCYTLNEHQSMLCITMCVTMCVTMCMKKYYKLYILDIVLNNKY